MSETTPAVDGQVLATIPAPSAHAVGLAHDGECLWVSDRDDRKIHKISAETGDILFTIAFDGDLTGTAWDGAYVWQADQVSRTISRIDPETGQIDRALKVEQANGDVVGICHQPVEGEQPEGLWYALSRRGQICMVKAEDGSFLKAYPTHSDISGVVPVGRHVYYSEPTTGKVHKMHKLAGSLIISYHVGGRPTGLTWDGEAFWVIDQEKSEIRRIRF